MRSINFLRTYLLDVYTVCLFKAHLDKFCMHQDVKYDFMADVTGSEIDQFMK